jgi:glycosyltransferase involved in cell wall biosynthesis
MSIISIIVPVYKVEKYLARCVESLRNQTLQDIEIILVDDGSPDRCPQMCDAFAKADPRIRVIHKKNGGVSSARNAGLDVATGDYITFVDSDDWIDPVMYAAMMEKAREHNCNVVMCDCLKEFPDRSELYTHNIRPGFYDRAALETEYFPHLLMMENVEYPATISNWLLLFRRELAEQVRYLTGVRYSEDLLFGARLMYRARSFYYMKEQAHYHYVMNPQSATHRFVPDKWNDYLKLHSGIREAFGSCEDFDFSRQIDLCLLFFLYNAVGDLYGAPLAQQEKKRRILEILGCSQVREMFTRLKIGQLPISQKQKIITWLYKKRLAIGLLCMYYENK